MNHYQRILVPCDFSPASFSALQQGAKMAESTGAELTLLHVLPGHTAENEIADRRAAALESLQQVLPAEHVLRLNVQFLVREGNAAREIVAIARESAVDLIVMGTRARTGIAHLALGSVAETVLRTADCPVMTVRKPVTETSENANSIPTVSPDDDLEMSPAVDLLRRAYGLRATDIHIDPINDVEYLVRLRIDGKLEEYCRLDRGVALRQLHQLELLARVDLNEKFLAKEGRIRALQTLPEAEIRLTVSPVMGGDAISMRIAPRIHVALPLENLGLRVEDQDKIQQILDQEEGVFLVSGPTGSGKTTTVYSMLNRLASASRNIVSIEDPVEYHVPYVRQLAVDERHGVTMTSGLKTILRMDPDVVFVGEIRDLEAASIVMRAASSGRHVFSTLHTRDVVSTITALRDLHVEANSLAANITGILNQRLVRCLCVACRESRDITDSERTVFDSQGISPPAQLFHSVGCEACRRRGFLGRIGVFEVALINRTIRDSISQGASELAIRQLLRGEGTPSLHADALRKVAAGVTSLSEVQQYHWT